MHESSKSAFETCFPERKLCPQSRPWWTAELSQLKQTLATHFNNWKNENFPRDEDNVFWNRFKVARKSFRKGVKNAQNKKIYGSLNKMNKLKNTHPQKFWTKVRKIRKPAINDYLRLMVKA